MGKNKFTLKCLVSLITILALAVVSYCGMEQLIEVYESDGGSYGTDVDAAIEMQSYAKMAETHLGLYLLFHEDIDRIQFFHHIELLKQQSHVLLERVSSPTTIRLIDKIPEKIKDLENIGRAMLSAHDTDPEKFHSNNIEFFSSIFYDASKFIHNAALEVEQNKIILSGIHITSEIKNAELDLLFSYLWNIEPNNEAKNRYNGYLDSIEDEIEFLKSAIYVNNINEYEYVRVIEQSVETIRSQGGKLISIYEDAPASFDFISNKELIKEFYVASSLIRESGVSIAKMERTYSNQFMTDARQKLQRLQLAIGIIFLLGVSILLIVHFEIINISCLNKKYSECSDENKK